MSKKLTLSLIIPCHNEEKAIRGCLEHVARLDQPPEEVILVDNNCTDDTVKIARRFPFVTIISEKKQGLIPARDRGFDYAKGDILARIDADSRVSPTWARTIRYAMAEPDLQGVSGPAKSFIDVHLPFIHSQFWSRVYFRFMRATLGFDVLWGPNMAIKRGAYEKIKPQLERDSTKVHEDQDISILMHKYRMSIKFLPELRITVDGSRSADIKKILEYEKRRRRTAQLHLKAGNITPPKRDIKKILTLAALAPLGLWASLQGLLYSTEVWLGFRSPN